MRLTATDATSGVATTMVKVDDGEWQPVTGPVTLPSRGAHRVAWFSTDVAGNAETAQHAQVAALRRPTAASSSSRWPRRRSAGPPRSAGG